MLGFDVANGMKVLILVLLEYTLGADRNGLIADIDERLNPCFVGIYSRSSSSM